MYISIVIEVVFAQTGSIQPVVPFLPDHVKGVVIFTITQQTLIKDLRGCLPIARIGNPVHQSNRIYFTIMTMIVFNNYKYYK
jgi:hypothetical protein